MLDLASVLRDGAAHPWLFLPIAMLLGALHALEPGHSKSLMAAFIVAIRGTARQAVLLGVAAAIGHTIVVWGLALVGLWLGDALVLDKAEPWLILLSGLMVVGLGARLLATIRRDVRRRDAHDHVHDHRHGTDLGHDHALHGHDHPHDHGDMDEAAHAAAHARAIEQKFAGRTDVTSWEIAWFGFTGGLLPCPAAIAVLLICLQLKQVSLGMAMVGAFSLGLAATLVAVGLVAAWGTRAAAGSWAGFGRFAERLPYFSGALVTLLGMVTVARGSWILMAG